VALSDLHPGQVVAVAFAGGIAVGTGLLSLPWATVAGEVAPLHDALFTATSAVCVTGLTTVDTATYWSTFGQVVIMLLIQVGGLGIMTLATLAAARGRFSGRVIAIFQPHLFSRTRDLLDDFADALGAADLALIAPIYPAREAPIPGVTHAALAARIPGPAEALPFLDAAVARIAALDPPLAPGDVILTLGAGDVDRVARALADG